MTNSRNDVVVIGAGDHAKVVVATVEAQGKYKVVGLLDDDASKHRSRCYGHLVLGGCDQLDRIRDQGVERAVLAVGDNFDRAELARLAVKTGFKLAQVIHPTAIILEGASVGEGLVVLSSAYIGADAHIGDGALLSVGALVAHDCVVGAWAQLCPGARLGGHVRIGDYSLIGMGASVLPGVTVGRQTIVGANAAVITDIPGSSTAVGVPARVVHVRQVEEGLIDG